MARLQACTIAMYREIEENSGQDVGLHIAGAVTCASMPERWEFLKSLWAINQTIGIESRLVTGLAQFPDGTWRVKTGQPPTISPKIRV